MQQPQQKPMHSKIEPITWWGSFLSVKEITLQRTCTSKCVW